MVEVEHRSEYIAAARFDTEMVYQSDVLVVPVQGGLGIRWRHLSGYEAPEANQILKARMKCMLTPSTGCHVGEGKILMPHIRCHAAGSLSRTGSSTGEAQARNSQIHRGCLQTLSNSSHTGFETGKSRRILPDMQLNSTWSTAGRQVPR